MSSSIDKLGLTKPNRRFGHELSKELRWTTLKSTLLPTPHGSKASKG